MLFIVLVGINGSNLHAAMGEAAQAMTDVNASGVLGYGASLIGFTVSYCSLASDYVGFLAVCDTMADIQTNTLPAHTSRLTLFLVVFFGFAIPIIVIQLLGAASQLAAAGIATWTDAAAVGTPDLLYAMVGAGKAARFVMVLFCFSVVANTAPTIYSCGLSLQVAVPWLVRSKSEAIFDVCWSDIQSRATSWRLSFLPSTFPSLSLLPPTSTTPSRTFWQSLDTGRPSTCLLSLLRRLSSAGLSDR